MMGEDATPREPQPARSDLPPGYPPRYPALPQEQPLSRSIEHRRLRQALLAAAGVGLLTLGAVGGFGLARATSSPVATMASQPVSAPSGGNQDGGGIPSGQGSNTAQATATTVGSITAVDGSTVTLQTEQGPSVTVTTSGSTRVRATAGDDVSALAVGDMVMVRGDLSANGSLVATVIIQGQLAGGSGSQRSGSQGSGGQGGAAGPGTSGAAPVTGT